MFKSGKVVAPNGKIVLEITLDNGIIFYSVTKENYAVIDNSKISIKTDAVDFSKNVTGVCTSYKEIDETYSVISRKTGKYINRANEMCCKFKKDNTELIIEARVYDNGYAFRYCLSNDYGNNIIVEDSQFAIVDGEDIWYMPYHFCYEGFFQKSNFSSLTADDISVPALIKTKKDYLLISEAALDGGYSGSMLETMGNGILQTRFVKEQIGPVQIVKSNFCSPWRFVIIGTLSDIIESNYAENLALPQYGDIDYSFVKPGVTSWTWLVGYKKMQKDPNVVKQYIDLAAKMGWQYYIIDEGWQPIVLNPFKRHKYGSDYGNRSWLNEVINYAKEKGIGLFLWTHCKNLKTPFMRKRLAEWAKMGIKGIKVDFFDCENQERMKLYDDIYRDCARLKLMVNAHGANKPTGEIRTYPNVLTREGIRGEEHEFLDSQQYTIIPFTRAAVGPADVTETLSSAGSTSQGFQTAISFIIQSGMHCLASKDTEYYESPTLPLYSAMPAVWDETRYVCGIPGEYICLRRRSGSDWYISGITTNEITFDIDYSFLEDGEYEATMYSSDESRKIVVLKSIITKYGTIKISLNKDDGFVIKISKNQ